jgi:hypothetical protein
VKVHSHGLVVMVEHDPCADDPTKPWEVCIANGPGYIGHASDIAHALDMLTSHIRDHCTKHGIALDDYGMGMDMVHTTIHRGHPTVISMQK